jgi:hypothetical protein
MTMPRSEALPADVDALLREHFTDDALLACQRTIGFRVAEEAARDIRMETNGLRADGVLEWDRWRPCRDAAAQIDPTRGGRPYPSALITWERRP